MTYAVAQTTDQITLGIDISKDRLDAHLHPSALVKQFDNDRKGIAKLMAWVTPLRPTRIIFEATGAYHRALEMALGKAGLPAVKINPLQTRRFAEATGKRTKTDPIDAAPDIASNVLCWPASATPCSQTSRRPEMKPLIAWTSPCKPHPWARPYFRPTMQAM